MGTTTITIEDNPNGGWSSRVKHDPPLVPSGDEDGTFSCTLAQAEGAKLYEHLITVQSPDATPVDADPEPQSEVGRKRRRGGLFGRLVSE